MTGLEEDGVAQKIVYVTLIGDDRALSSKHPRSQRNHQHPKRRSHLLKSGSSCSTRLTSRPAGFQRTRDAVVTFIADKFHQGDIGGVVVDGKMANNRLTSDREELRKAAAARRSGEPAIPSTGDAGVAAPSRRARGVPDRERQREALDAAVARACADDPDGARGPRPTSGREGKPSRRRRPRHTLQTLRVIEALSGGLARVPGPKTVVFLSDGFALQNLDAELRLAVGQAARAGAHFYPSMREASTGQRLADSSISRWRTIPREAARFDMQADGTNSLAVDTGGFAIRNENNFGRALDTIQRDAATYYVLGVQPDERHARRQVPQHLGEGKPPRASTSAPAEATWRSPRSSC